MISSEFEQFVLGGPVAEGAFKPTAYYDPDGDCFEFIASDESYYAERLDSLVTVYMGMESNEVVGSQIKGVSRFVRDVLDRYPGLKIMIHDGRVKLELLFTLRLCESFQDPEGTKVVLYKKLVDAAERTQVEFDMTPIAA